MRRGAYGNSDAAIAGTFLVTVSFSEFGRLNELACEKATGGSKTCVDIERC
jgi:hypothetical protein